MLTPAHVFTKIRRCLPKSKLVPWQAEVYRLVSWWDVEKFAAEKFYAIGMLLETLSQRIGNMSSEDSLARLRLDLRIITAHCATLGLKVSAELITQKSSGLKSIKSANAMGRDLKAISDCIAIEMKQTLFLYVPTERARWYVEPLKDWERVIETVPGTIHDIEEGSRSFALDRYGAAVFHMMQVAEHGALEVGKLIDLNDPKAGWRSVRLAMIRIVQNTEYKKLTPLEQKHFPLLEQLLPLMLSMERAWRDKISHAANRLILINTEFQSYVAEEIISATRAFMRRLAEDLPKKPRPLILPEIIHK